MQAGKKPGVGGGIGGTGAAVTGGGILGTAQKQFGGMLPNSKD